MKGVIYSWFIFDPIQLNKVSHLMFLSYCTHIISSSTLTIGVKQSSSSFSRLYFDGQILTMSSQIIYFLTQIYIIFTISQSFIKH